MPKLVNNKWVFTDNEIDEQIQRGKALYSDYVKDKPIAIGYKFDPVTRILSIHANDGSRIEFPVSKIKELQNASDEDIRRAYITEAGDAIHWDNLDAHYTVAGLAANIFGTRAWMQELGKIGGKSKSMAKTTAARLNGLRGGRPRRIHPKGMPQSRTQVAVLAMAHRIARYPRTTETASIIGIVNSKRPSKNLYSVSKVGMEVATNLDLFPFCVKQI